MKTVQTTLVLVFLTTFDGLLAETVTDGPIKFPPDDGRPLHVQTVDLGKTAHLSCWSNIDKHHNFLFWQLANENPMVVGPGNAYNETKYDFEILSGDLIIRSVSTAEEGVYRCISRGVSTEDINVRSVRMIVKRDWEDVIENDPNLNYFRGVMVVASLMIVGAIAYGVYKLKRRHRLQGLLEASDDEEDSGEELFRAPGTSRSTGNIVLDHANEDGSDSPKISIDFEDILKNSSSK